MEDPLDPASSGLDRADLGVGLDDDLYADDLPEDDLLGDSLEDDPLADPLAGPLADPLADPLTGGSTKKPAMSKAKPKTGARKSVKPAL